MTITGYSIIQSLLAVEEDGTEPKEIQQDRGGFLARLFDPDPTLPLWQKTRTVIIQVPHYKPAIYKMMDKFIVHPALIPSLMKALEEDKKQRPSPSDVFRW